MCPPLNVLKVSNPELLPSPGSETLDFCLPEHPCCTKSLLQYSWVTP